MKKSFCSKLWSRNTPSAPSVGITTLGYSWLLGGYEYAGTINQIFYGWISDVRIVNRPLAADSAVCATRRACRSGRSPG